ncbi:sortase [Candidatus Gottesmanbacteria bacterium]|nr:sortase [Candidatus Gottesmanbacteria bacterium]
MSLGAGLLVWVLWPIISFLLVSESLFASVIGPVPDASLAPVVLAAVDSKNAVDYTNANIWFPTSPQKKVVTPVNSYTLSIPKLKIKNVSVSIAGDDLGKALIHYGGTGLPGEYGTAVVFGHSTLPQFFSPTNYKTIFSLLPTLKIQDEIYVMYDGVEYRYIVYEMVVTDPTDLAPLEQHFDDSYLTLITCVPPGTYWKRLNVRARLERI